MSRVLSSVSALALLTTPALADQPVEKVVVTASRIGSVPEDRLGTAVTIIDGKQLDERQTRFVSDVLRDVPGVAVSRSGGVGSFTQVRMRGGEANHTLVLLDGADLSDPYLGEFDFSGLLASDIERIEILRGSQSALYGSDAIGGVINFIARRGKGSGNVEAFAEGGSFGTWQAGANIGAGDDAIDAFLSINHHATSGTNLSRFEDEDDGEQDTSLFFNVGIRPTENFELRALARYVETHTDTDPQDPFATPTEGLVIDGADTSGTKQLYANLSAEFDALGDRWQTRLTYSYADADRNTISTNFFAFPAPALEPASTSGTRNKVSLVSAFTFDTGSASHRLTGAIDWKHEEYTNFVPAFLLDAAGSTETKGYVASYDVSIGDVDAGAAYRRDDSDRFKSADTYRLQVSWRLSDTTRLRATAGSGIKSPTFTELFGFFPTFFIGNPNLKPEKSVGWDAGFDQTFAGGKARFTATYFEAELEHEIFNTPGFPGSVANRRTKSDRRGIELTLDADLAPDWSLNAAYTYLDATEGTSGQVVEEIRRPPHVASFNLTHRFLGDRGSATLSVRYNGKQSDLHFLAAAPFQETVTLDAFTLVNVNASYDLTDNVQVFGRVENLFDEKYEEVFSYRSPGIAAYAGIRTRF